MGLHLTFDPQEIPIEAQVSNSALKRGIRLNNSELNSLMINRVHGIAKIRVILDSAKSDFSLTARQNLSEKIADALIDMSMESQFAREMPNAEDSNHQSNRNLDLMFRQNTNSVVGSMIKGLSITVNWGKPPDPKSGVPYNPWDHLP